MEPIYDNQGFLTKVQKKFAYGLEVAVTKFRGLAYFNIYDNSKCWDSQTRTYDKSRDKSITLKA